ncbi:MAG: glycoside hydrolase family 127 protein [Bacteroidaceae bacterium]|nr:glycoside hydrolase family 127 protein [Bacteroidaceae bacterium]
MRHLITLLLVTSTLWAGAQEVKWVDDPHTIPATSTNYVNNRAPLRTQPFLKLPVTAIQPRGWVRRHLELQRDGLSGQLGEISAWLDKQNNAWLSEQGDHGWEEVPYWLRGYSNLSYILRDKKMLAETDVWIKGILRSAKPDGYFGPVNEHDGRRELWANMLALQILQDYYDYSGDKQVLDVMKGYFRWELNYPEEKFLRDYWENSRGGDNLLSVIWLYNRTGESFLLDLIHKIHRCTANWCQSSSLPNWHNVNIAECFREPAEYYLLTGEERHLRATYNNQQLIRRAFGQVPGGMFGADENARMGYFDPRQGTETCGFVEQMLSDEILMAQTGDVLWADNLEDVAFNSYPAALMPDFRALRYITSPNMVQSDSENHRPGIDNAGPFLSMNPFSSRCCQHNHAMGWPYYSQNLVLASADGGAALMTYADMRAELKVADGQTLVIDEQTHYPFSEDIELNLSLRKPATFPIYLRIPHWAKHAAVTVNGKTTNLRRAGRLLCIRGEWKQGDRIQLHLPMTLSLRTWQVNQRSVSVDLGPLTMSLLIQERYVRRDSRSTAIGDSKWQAGADASKWPTTEIYADSPWNYALVPDVRDMKVTWGAWPSDDYPWTQQNAPVRVKAKGRRVPSWTIDETGLCGVLPHADEPREKVETITLVPMGAARLRISAFPRARR